MDRADTCSIGRGKTFEYEVHERSGLRGEGRVSCDSYSQRVIGTLALGKILSQLRSTMAQRVGSESVWQREDIDEVHRGFTLPGSWALEKAVAGVYPIMVSEPELCFAQLGVIKARVEVSIEVTRGSYVKRRPNGSIDFVSPLRCPYNYGSITDTLGEDGDPWDALVLGDKLDYGLRCVVPVRGVVDFIDAGQRDPKVVCSHAPLLDEDRRAVEVFFLRYARLKGVLNRLRLRRGRTCFGGWLEQL